MMLAGTHVFTLRGMEGFAMLAQEFSTVFHAAVGDGAVDIVPNGAIEFGLILVELDHALTELHIEEGIVEGLRRDALG